MADEQETIAPAPELETPAIETQEAETPEVEKPETVGLPEPELEPETEDAPEPEIEFVSVERNGKTYQVPKELEGELLMQSDYTKKTQTVAEKAKALESREAEINQRLEATEAELDARADLRQVTRTLEEFGKLTQADWDAHHANDPMGTERAWRQFQMLKDQKAELEGKISKAASERTGVAEQGLATRVQETLDHAKKAIPGWKPDTIPKLVEFAQSLNIPEATIKANWSPTFLDLLHLAHTGKQLLSKPAPTPKAITPPPAPLEKVTGKSTPGASRSLAEVAKGDDMEAYAALRQAGRVR